MDEQLTPPAGIDLLEQADVSEKGMMDSATDGDHSESSVLNFSRSVIASLRRISRQAEGIETVVAGFGRILIVNLVPGLRFAGGDEQQNLDIGKPTDPGDGVKRVRFGIHVGGQVPYFWEDPADDGEHRDAACEQE